MARSDLLRWVPGASLELAELLAPARGPVELPNRSEIFGPERFAQHGRSLADTHAAAVAVAGSAVFFPRLRENIRILREAHRYIGSRASSGYDVSPASEWLLDNFHLVEVQFHEINAGLPRGYFRDLPVLQNEPLVGLPRVYGVAWAFVAHTDSAFNEKMLVHFLQAYEAGRELTLGELWALPTTLRVVLIENLRRLAERAAVNKAAREVANLCADEVGPGTPAQLDQVLELLNRRSCGDAFIAQIAQQIQDRRAPEDTPVLEWLGRVAPHLAEIQTRLPAEQAADNLSTSSAITSLRSIGDADWPDIVAATSVLIKLMVGSPAFAAEREDTRDQTLHAIEALAKKSRQSERVVATRLLDLMHGTGAQPAAGSLEPRNVASYWLRGAGQPELLAALGLPARSPWRPSRLLARYGLALYLGSIALASAGLVAWLLGRHGIALPPGAAPWITALAALLTFFPASEAVVAVVNRLISESSRPERLPRLALVAGIPADDAVLVVIPAMLSKPASAAELAHQLQLHYLANPEANAQFGLLTDWSDADQQSMPGDAPVLAAAVARIDALNRLYPGEPGRAAALRAAPPRASLCRIGAALDGLGAQARQARAVCWRFSIAAEPARSWISARRRGSTPARATCSRSTATPACHRDACAS